MQSFMELENRYLADVYWKRPVVLVRGKGAVVWDSEGREYIDCGTGFGVALLGHCHPRVVEAIKKQCEKLLTCHGSFYNDVRAEYLAKLSEVLPKNLGKVFFSNSGAEAVEAALKIACRYTGKNGFIAMKNSYHGKTLGALAVTYGAKYREPFKQLIHSNVKFTPFGDASRVEELIDEETAAVIVEPVQGEGGIHTPPPDFLPALREICDRKGVLLIFDEVQCGFGRTGRMWAHQHWDIEPDILCAAKAVAGGVPLGITAAREEVMSALKRAEHTNTFGGNPLAMAAALAALEALVEERLVERAAELGAYFKEKLLVLKDKYRGVREVRGLGLMLGVELRFPVVDVIMGALSKGVILLEAGKTVVRLLPPLVITREQIDKVVEVLDEELAKLEEAKVACKS